MIQVQRRCGQCGAQHYIEQTIRECPDKKCGALLEWTQQKPATRRVELQATITVEVPVDEDAFTAGTKAWRDTVGRLEACKRHCRLSTPVVQVVTTSAKVLDE